MLFNNKLKLYFLSSVFCFITCINSFGQNKIDLKAFFDIENKQIKISQTIQYQNTTKDELQTIYLNNWSHSYSSKKTQLAHRLADEYKNEFHLAKEKDRGNSIITSIKQDHEDLIFTPLKEQIDILKVELKKPLKPNSSYNIDIEYTVKIANAKFTRYGITDSGDINLRYWYITPVIYNGEWQYYSNKDLDDMFIPKADVILDIEYPNNYILTSELNTSKTVEKNKHKKTILKGSNVISNKLFLNKAQIFNNIKIKNLTISSSINNEGLDVIDNVLITEKIANFLIENFDSYPHEKLLISAIDEAKNPLYGLSFLPKFVKAYPSHFKYELKLLKIALQNYLENTLLINPRKEQWLLDGIQTYYLIDYVDKHYPNMKFLGSIANIWGVRSFHISKMNFNDKYTLAYMLMTRTNKDQPLTMPKDSLLKFNENIANKYKAGIGFKYLDDFTDNSIIKNSLSKFIIENKLKYTSTDTFKTYLKSKTKKDIDWFFNDYLSTRKKIDFKIKKLTKTEDSITLTIRNKRNNNMPVSLFSLKNDSILSKTWIENITKDKTLTIPRNNANKLVLNYDNVIPENNLRDNWKSLKGFFFNNKPLQFRFFKDIENPNYNQVFFMPILEFNNIYDGITLGIKAYNKTVLRKTFNYKIEPQYALKSKTLTGSTSISNIHYLENSNLYHFSYGISGSYTSFAEDLFVRQIKPSVTFVFREKNDFRSNKRNVLRFRYVDINRDQDLNNILTTNTPNYSILNARYVYSNDNLINFNKLYTDFQIGSKFSKIALTYEYRKLFESNRQLNLRFFTGSFLKNNTDINSNYFSFALDRPTDYLFDYSYLGRSEASGIFSQQYITAEGGFKSKLKTPFANQWISTINMSTTLWRYVLAYGDIGFVKNKFNSPNFVYDSGLRFNLVTDYFEVYLPIYSNLGWEMGQANYSEKIRFKFTMDPKTLLGLFRRRWF